MAKSDKPKKTRAEILTEAPAAPQTPDLLSTGCTVLDVAFGGGVPKGGYLYLVGDSGSSKTWLTFCLFAEAARNPKFKGYDFVFDNAENGALFDVERYFGKRVRDRLCAPSKKAEGSTTVEEFYFNVEASVRRGPCIYVLDSMDALQPESEEANFGAKLKFHETGTGADKIKGSMGMAKAKVNANHISRIANKTLRSNGSILVVIGQTRDMMNAQFPGMRTRSGGRALKFYAHLEAWTKVKAPLKARARGKDREIGSLIEIDVQKNRVNGWEGKTPLITFLKGFGVDDVGTNIAYLLDERHWKRIKGDKTSKRPPADTDDEDSGKPFAAPEFDFEGTEDELVDLIQDQKREGELKALVARVWAEIAAAAAPKRKNPYSETGAVE